VRVVSPRQTLALAFLVGCAAAVMAADGARAAEPGFDDLVPSTTHSVPLGARFGRTAGIGVSTGVGATAGYAAGDALARAAGFSTGRVWGPVIARAVGTVSPTVIRWLPLLPGLVPSLVGAIGGGVANALLQKWLEGRVDWGAVAFATAGGVAGAALFGLPGGIVGSLAGDVIWRGGKALVNGLR
jgi:hypothetical protein